LTKVNPDFSRTPFEPASAGSKLAQSPEETTMNLLIFSDTHNRTSSMHHVINSLITQTDIIIHLGDNIEDINFFEQSYPTIPFYAVPGNCDYNTEKNDKIIEINKKRIFLTHGHEYNVKFKLDKLKKAAADYNADACFFGHSHDAHLEWYNNTLFLNPGSISYPRGRYGVSYAFVNIHDEGTIRGNVIELTPNGSKPIF
jgi:putative phosphoesterase